MIIKYFDQLNIYPSFDTSVITYLTLPKF